MSRKCRHAACVEALHLMYPPGGGGAAPGGGTPVPAGGGGGAPQGGRAPQGGGAPQGGAAPGGGAAGGGAAPGGGAAAGGGPGGAAAGGGPGGPGEAGAAGGGGPGGPGGVPDKVGKKVPRVAQQGQGGGTGGSGAGGPLWSPMLACAVPPPIALPVRSFLITSIHSPPHLSTLRNSLFTYLPLLPKQLPLPHFLHTLFPLLHFPSLPRPSSTSSGAFNVLYVLTATQLPQQSPPTNATITRGRSVAFTIPATWRETTGQPGFKQNDADDDDDGDCPDGKCYSYAAAGYWANADKTVTDMVNAVVADPTAFQGHMALPSGEDVNGKFELD
ncbi:unnamed protein product [Closterium sp. NIES-54]